MTQSVEDKRLQWLDMAKWFTFALVVAGHALNHAVCETFAVLNNIFKFIYSFHMPAFFYFTGYIFYLNSHKRIQNSIRHNVHKEFMRLMIPYILYSIAVAFVINIAYMLPIISSNLDNTIYSNISPLEWIIGILIGTNKFAVHLWFLYALFIMRVLSIYAEKVHIPLYASVLGGAILLICIQYFFCPPGILSYVFRLYIYFTLGIYSAKNKDRLDTNGRLLLGGIGLSVLFIQTFFVNSIKGNVLNYISFIVTFISVLFTIQGIRGMCELVSNKKLLKGSTFKKSTMIPYLFHQPLLAISGTFLFLLLPVKTLGATLVTIMVSLAITIGFVVIVNRVFNRFKHQAHRIK